MNRKELIEEAAKAAGEAAWGVYWLAIPAAFRDRFVHDAEIAWAVFEKAQAPTGEERHWSDAAASAYPGDEYDNADLRTAFGRGVKWERRRPAQTEPTDAQVEAAAKAYWPAYSAAVRNTRPDPKFGITPAQGHKCTAAGMRAALTAALTAGQEEQS